MTDEHVGQSIRLLRQRRGWSQAELAHRLAVSPITVNRWENGRVVPRPAMLQRLHQLNAEATEPAAPHPEHAATGSTVPPWPAPGGPLLGRERELLTVQTMLAGQRLVTIVGPGGAGKTRLALEIVHAADLARPGGARFVDLSTASDAASVAQTAARALGVRETNAADPAEHLVAWLQGFRGLIVLDNCEHVLAASAALVETLLASGSAARVLATSRAPLGVGVETIHQLPPLTPEPALALFLARARLHNPAFAPDDRQRRVIAGLCRRLDFLPLAIELAAARTALLSVDQIADRLDRRFALLSDPARTGPARQQTLETTIAWSCQLLTAAEQQLFQALGVFAGSFTLDAAEAVNESPETIDTLHSLVRQSLVVATTEAEGEPRFRLLESIAAYARQWLQTGGNADRIADRHAAWFGRLAHTTAAETLGAKQATALARLDREHDNLVAALTWLDARDGDPRPLPLATALGAWWRARGQLHEGIFWLERVLTAAGAPAADRAAALIELGLLRIRAGLLAAARVDFETALVLAESPPADDLTARALDGLGLVLAGQRDLAGSTAAHERAFALFSRLHDRGGAAASRHHLGNLANLTGRLDESERIYLESWTLAHGSGDATTELLVLSNLGEIAARLGKYERALACYDQSRRLAHVLGDADRLATLDTNTAEVLLIVGDNTRAAPLASEGVRQFRAMGHQAALAHALYTEGAALAATSDHPAALAALRESLAIFHQQNDWLDAVYLLEAIAFVFAAAPRDGSGAGREVTPDRAHAARLLGGADAIRTAEQIADYPLFDRARLLALLGDPPRGGAFATDYQAGQTAARAEIVADALLLGSLAAGAPAPFLITRRPPPAGHGERAPRLSPRQRELLSLAARGLSNREIAAALGLSERTVERRMTTIYQALAVDRRSAAVARASALGLLEPVEQDQT